MANLKEQVNDLTGFASTDDTALAQWFTDGAKEIANMFPPPLLHAMAAHNTLNASATTYDMDNGGKVLSVVRNNGTRNFPCREIPATFSGHKDDSSSLMYYGTATDPVYYIDNGLLNIYPAPTGSGGSGTALVTAINYPTLVATGDGTDDITASGTTSIVNYPNEADYIVVLYSSLRALQRLMNDKASSLPSVLTSPTLPVTPTVPTTSAQTLTISGTAPTYTGPVVSPDFTQVDTYIDTDEDVELAGAKIEAINSQLQEFSQKVQDSIQIFNKENVDFQSKLSKDVQDVTMADREEARKLSKYGQEVASYQAEVSGKIGKFTSEIQDFSAVLQKIALDYGWLQGQYKQLQGEYQRGLSMLRGQFQQPQQEERGR